MAFLMNTPRFRKYKFFGNNMWGRLFICKRFRGKDIIYSRINKKLTLKAITVNPVKLRQKKKTFRTLCLYSSLQLKRYYHSIRETHFRRILRKGASGLSRRFTRAYDRILTLLELRLDGLLLKSGLFSHPTQVKQFIRHGHILVNNQKVDLPSIVLEPGSVISFNTEILAEGLVYKLLLSIMRLHKNAKRLKVKGMYFVYFPILVGNRLFYLNICYRTLRISVLSAPRYAKCVYYPFNLDSRKVLGGYPFVR